MALIADLQATLQDAETLQADAETAAARAAHRVADLLALESPAEGWNHEHRAQLLQQAEAQNVPLEGAPKVAMLLVTHNLAQESQTAVIHARDNLLAEVGHLAINRLQELAARRPLSDLEAIAEARRADLTPGPLGWVWFPGRGVWRWALRRLRSRQFAKAALGLRLQLDELDELLGIFRLLSPWVDAPEHVERHLEAAEQYLVTHRQLLGRLTHGD